MMEKKISEVSTQQNRYEVDLNAIKRQTKKSEYTEFVQVRLTVETKQKLLEHCRQEKIYVSTLLRAMTESYLKEIRE